MKFDYGGTGTDTAPGKRRNGGGTNMVQTLVPYSQFLAHRVPAVPAEGETSKKEYFIGFDRRCA
jgi:hypothetical protein